MLTRRLLLTSGAVSLVSCGQAPLSQSLPTATSAAVVSLLVPETHVNVIHTEELFRERDPRTLKSPIALNATLTLALERQIATRRPDLRLVTPAIDSDTFAVNFQSKSTFFQTPITPMKASFAKIAHDAGVDMVFAVSDAGQDVTYSNGKWIFLRVAKDALRNDVSCSVYVMLHVFDRTGDLLLRAWYGYTGIVPAQQTGLGSDLSAFSEPAVQKAMNVLLREVAARAAAGALNKLPL